MKQACVEAIAQTLGRQPKADELKGIEDRGDAANLLI